MLNTRLLLIEGLPGAGKTTASERIGTFLEQQGYTCRWHLEEDEDHPIACLDFKLRDLPRKLPPLWRAFTRQALTDSGVTIIESRLWQNTALFMYLSEYSVEEILGLQHLVWHEIAPLSPVLLYLYQDEVQQALGRLANFRDEQWFASVLGTTLQYPWFRSRDLKDFTGWTRFFQEWQKVADILYRDWLGDKLKLEDPYKSWPTAYQQIYRFLHIEQGRKPAGS